MVQMFGASAEQYHHSVPEHWTVSCHLSQQSFNAVNILTTQRNRAMISFESLLWWGF